MLGGLWTDSENSAQDTEETMRWDSTEWERLEPLKWGAIQDASRSFKEVTAIVDGWHPRHFGLLSEGALRALANILNVIELLGIFPTTTQNLLVNRAFPCPVQGLGKGEAARLGGLGTQSRP